MKKMTWALWSLVLFLGMGMAFAFAQKDQKDGGTALEKPVFDPVAGEVTAGSELKFTWDETYDDQYQFAGVIFVINGTDADLEVNDEQFNNLPWLEDGDVAEDGKAYVCQSAYGVPGVAESGFKMTKDVTVKARLVLGELDFDVMAMSIAQMSEVATAEYTVEGGEDPGTPDEPTDPDDPEVELPHIYLQEGFDGFRTEFDFKDSLDAAIWNLAACTKISEEVGHLYFFEDYMDEKYGGWVNDPLEWIMGGLAETVLDGTYQIVSNPIQLLDNDLINLVSVVYTAELYDEYGDGAPWGDQSFGVRVREEGAADWTEVGMITGDEIEYEGEFVAVLGPQFRGKTVEVAIYFTTKRDENVSFLFMMNEVTFAAYEETLEVSTQVSAPQWAYDEFIDVKLSIKNTGNVPVSSLAYAYTIDDDAKTGTIPVKCTPALNLGASMTTSTRIALQDLGFGGHTLKVRLTELNGEAVAESEADVLDFYIVDESQLTQPYVPLFEGFTASSCGPCANANKFLNPALETLQKDGAINVIKYQMDFPGDGDPYYIDENETRMYFYDEIFGWNGAWFVPVPIYNGEEMLSKWDAADWSERADILKERAKADHTKKAVLAIDITNVTVDETNLSVAVDITPSVAVEGRVFVVVVEKTTTGNAGGNGETEFHNVAMAFASDEEGDAKSFEVGKKETLTYKLDMNGTHVEEMGDLQIVCFVQHENGHIFQSSSIVKSGNLFNENAEVLGHVRLYPNPAAEYVNITHLEGADVEIINLTGRRVYAENNVSGNLEVSLSSFTPGVYTVRLTKDGQSAYRKLVVR